jgi:outer membrane protein
MKTNTLPFLALAAALAAVPGQAAAKSGDVNAKLLATLVAPDGKIKDVKLDAIGLPAGTQAKADDNVVPTVAIEYYLTDAISVETIAGVTQHDVEGRGPLNGAALVSNANIVPATLTIKYHLGAEGGIRPYVGAGPSYFIFIDEKVGSDAAALGATRVKINDKVGMALQAGIDVPVGDSGLSVTLDAKRYFMRTTATFYAGQVEALKTRHKLDPWVVSAGIGFRF